MTSKAMSLRMPWELAEGLEAVARVDGMTMAEAIRKAVADHIVTRRAEPAFQERLRKRIQEDQEVLERLAEEGGLLTPSRTITPAATNCNCNPPTHYEPRTGVRFLCLRSGSPDLLDR